MTKTANLSLFLPPKFFSCPHSPPPMMLVQPLVLRKICVHLHLNTNTKDDLFPWKQMQISHKVGLISIHLLMYCISLFGRAELTLRYQNSLEAASQIPHFFASPDYLYAKFVSIQNDLNDTFFFLFFFLHEFIHL